ncbi:hypothetical protein Cylst_4377 [Cylindrospermum stagnale PCC 7417]|uniref:Uncharacterized protein n=1 Tax=Cylindrospermum stagnale PCC 7417 TaxID=56107 RepID=K9X470_9NOST|nr:hypothetical protein [Cylindrospermum stagnale]AFZ26467.1 hypothetical protein Cylst_4377 [Cylindrospermum stagnale PCC 7417]
MRITYTLWNPIINSDRTGCSFDVTPGLYQVASGTLDLMKEFLQCLGIEAEPREWNIEPFCSAYYSEDMVSEYYQSRHLMAWRVNISFTQTYREYSDLEFCMFNPVAVWNGKDDTWEEMEDSWDWKSMQYIAIVDFELWEWSGFLEDYQLQKQPIFAQCMNFETYLLRGLFRQVRFNLGVINFPDEEEKVMEFLRACEQYDVSNNWAKTLAGW